MNDNTLNLLNKIADRLGVTTQSMWSILLKQARIEAITSLTVIAILVLLGIALYRAHIYYRTEVSIGGNYKQTRYSTGNSEVIIGALYICWLICILVAFFYIQDIINGLLHPDYWALNKLSDMLKDIKD